MAKPRISLAARLSTLLIALAPLGAWAQTAQPGAEPITISLSDYAFAPAALDLKAGTAYRLHFHLDRPDLRTWSQRVLASTELDPVAKIPEFKACAVSIMRATEAELVAPDSVTARGRY